MSLLGICAVTFVELTNVVGRGLPLTCTTDPLTNPDPSTVKVKLPPKTSTGFGEMLEIEGTGLSTASVTAAEVPPPGAGLRTVMFRLAPVATSEDGICAVN